MNSPDGVAVGERETPEGRVEVLGELPELREGVAEAEVLVLHVQQHREQGLGRARVVDHLLREEHVGRGRRHHSLCTGHVVTR